MNINAAELDRIRLEVGIHSGYRQIERHPMKGLVGSRQFGERRRPLPSLRRDIDRAALVFRYLSSQLLHDLNRMTIMLNTWEEHVHPVPKKVLKELVQTMETYILEHGGQA
jgi:hypothetical protein